MDRWIFRFPPLVPHQIELPEVPIHGQYPLKLLRWKAGLNIIGDDVLTVYNNNAFTDEHRLLYDQLFKFYGEMLLDVEIRVYASLRNEQVDKYLAIASHDYKELQNELQLIIKGTGQPCYINSIQRRQLFIDVQVNRGQLAREDITPYIIPKLEMFQLFNSPYITIDTYAIFLSSGNRFSETIQRLRQIDPFGQMYMTSNINLETIRKLIQKFPKYNSYFSNKIKLQKILEHLVEQYALISLKVDTVRLLIQERENFSRPTRDDLLEKQYLVLSSRKPENLIDNINKLITKLNSTILTFNLTSTIIGKKRTSVNILELTDNFFYSDYMVVQQSIEAGLKSKLGDILKILE